MYVIFFSSLPRNEYWGFWQYISQGMKLTTHLHLVPGVRMSATTLLLPLYASGNAESHSTLFLILSSLLAQILEVAIL
jgi:hypothetical protein